MSEVSQLSPEARGSLQRLVASPSMARAPRVYAVLKFMVGELLAGHADTVNEQRIGEGAFGRVAGDGSVEDNLVRVTVGHLRTRLEEYYRAEGSQERWMLEVPKGRYVPLVRLRGVMENVPDPPVRLPATPVESAGPAPASTRRRSTTVAIATLVLVVFGLAYLLLSKGTLMVRTQPQGVLPQLFQGRNSPLTVVVTDENLMAYRYLTGKTVVLQSYLSLQYLADTPATGPAEKSSLEYVRLRQATSTASTTVAVALQGALQPYGIRVRHPMEVGTPDFQHDSLILLGGPWVNPWVQLFEDKLDFRTYPPPGERMSEIHNMHPRKGEREVYAGHTENGIEVSYLRVAVLPNLTGTGHVVLIGGIRGASQEAGCNLLLDPAKAGEILRRFGAADVAHLPPFELLIEVRGVSHTPLDLRVVAGRPY